MTEAARGASRPTRAGARVFSIRWIVTVAAVTLTASAVLSVGTVAERNARRALTAELTSRLVLEARNLALTSAGVLLSEYPELTLHPLIKEKLARQPELSFAVVADRAGVIQGAADPHRLGTRYEAPADLEPAVDGPPLRPGERLERARRELVASVPVMHASGTLLGRVTVGMRTSYLDSVIARARREQTVILALFLLAGVFLSFVVVSHVLKPVGALRAGIERIASGDLETPVRVQDRTELGLLADAMNEMAAGLKRAQAQMVERERLAREMELACEVQGSILPAKRVTAGSFVIEGSQRAATEVGGDYYDYFPLPDGRVGLAVADVSGKGLAGCLVMSMLYALLRADRGATQSPAALLVALDEQLSETLRLGSFVTMFYGVLDPRTGRLVYASAGHNPTLIYRRASGVVEAARSRGIPLGAIRGGAIRATLDDLEITLEPGDALLQFTDGISEAFDASGREQFGQARMEAALRELAHGGPHAVIQGLFERLSQWTADGARLDDETVLAVYRDPAYITPAGLEEVPAGEAVPLAIYNDAKRRGSRLVLSGGADALTKIRPWLERSLPLESIPRHEAELLATTLYEVCANVAEHGYAHDPTRDYELWWVPPAGNGAAARESPPRARGRAGGDQRWSDLGEGFFLLRDQGVPFQANDWRGQDLSDPGIRSRGRGFGLEIIHRAMKRIVYYPSTSVGNVTWMCFGGSAVQDKEARHVG